MAGVSTTTFAGDKMGKYWTKKEISLVAPLFKDWQIDTSNAPVDGTWFLGRITDTNLARAVMWDETCGSYRDAQGRKVNICQWISFADFGQIRSCVWRGM